MSKNKSKVQSSKSKVGRTFAVLSLLSAVCLTAVGCRYDMQDQPRYKYYKKSDFFSNGMGSRPLVEGTVPRGYLREDKALYTGKKDGAALSPNTLSAEGGKQQTGDGTNAQLGDAQVNRASQYPDDVSEFPLPVTQELINRGEERYRVFCIVCHGPNGAGDGMIVRRGYTKPTSYHTDELRAAPVGHFYDVITNGWGRMSGYASQVAVADRWAIVAYIRTLQASQDPNVINPDAIKQNQQATQNKTQAAVDAVKSAHGDTAKNVQPNKPKNAGASQDKN